MSDSRVQYMATVGTTGDTPLEISGPYDTAGEAWSYLAGDRLAAEEAADMMAGRPLPIASLTFVALLFATGPGDVHGVPYGGNPNFAETYSVTAVDVPPMSGPFDPADSE